jgi:HSP20 family protein
MPRGPLGIRDPFAQLRRQMEQILEDLFEGRAFPGPARLERERPLVNIWEDQDNFFVEMEVPGVKSEGVDLSVVGNELTVKVHYPDDKAEGVTYHRRERPVGEYARLVRFPAEVNADRVEASLENGVLTVKLPKAEAARPRKINVVIK